MAEQSQITDHPDRTYRTERYATDGWRPISCTAADEIRRRPEIVPISSKTDLDGFYGEPEVFTEWGTRDEQPMLREHRWPPRYHDWPSETRTPDAHACEHYGRITNQEGPA